MEPHTEQVVQIELVKLRPSPFNPRKLFRAEDLADLAASIAAAGIQQPLLVRPVAAGNGITHEIVAGARRYAAAAQVRLERLPCIVRALTDEEARHAQIVENLQRENISAIEEAQAYQDLLKMQGADHQDNPKGAPAPSVEALAKQIGKSKRYVYNRLALLKTAPEVQAALREGKIGAAQAQELVPLKPSQQAEFVQEVIRYEMPVQQIRNQVKWRFREQPKPQPKSKAQLAKEKRWREQQAAREARWKREAAKAEEQRKFEEALHERVIAGLWPALEKRVKAYRSPKAWRNVMGPILTLALENGQRRDALKIAKLTEKSYRKAPEGKRLAVALLSNGLNHWHVKRRDAIAALAGVDVKAIANKLRAELAAKANAAAAGAKSEAAKAEPKKRAVKPAKKSARKRTKK